MAQEEVFDPNKTCNCSCELYSFATETANLVMLKFGAAAVPHVSAE